jgi:tripartite-type tricarboxylate transporter receptor subunit TctC
MMFGSVASVMPHIKSGKIRVLAVSSKTRSNVAPEIPTLHELGFKDFNVTAWYGLLVPKNTPELIIDRIAKAAQEVIQLPEVNEAMAKQGLEMSISTPSEFSELIKNETSTWRDLNKILKITAN